MLESASPPTAACLALDHVLRLQSKAVQRINIKRRESSHADRRRKCQKADRLAVLAGHPNPPQFCDSWTFEELQDRMKLAEVKIQCVAEGLADQGLLREALSRIDICNPPTELLDAARPVYRAFARLLEEPYVVIFDRELDDIRNVKKGFRNERQKCTRAKQPFPSRDKRKNWQDLFIRYGASPFSRKSDTNASSYVTDMTLNNNSSSSTLSRSHSTGSLTAAVSAVSVSSATQWTAQSSPQTLLPAIPSSSKTLSQSSDSSCSSVSADSTEGATSDLRKSDSILANKLFPTGCGNGISNLFALAQAAVALEQMENKAV